MKIRLRTFFLLSFLLLLALALAAGGAAWMWATHPMRLPTPKVDFTVEPGSSPRTIAHTLNKAGVPLWDTGFALLARLTERDTLIKSGGYEVVLGDSPWLLLERMARGERSERQITFLEGWTYRQMREALRAHPDVRQTLDGVSDAELMTRLGSDIKHPEGLFFPDTYVFAAGTTDFDILRRAYAAEQQLLQEVWAQRAENLPISTPYEALILASLIEKETGQRVERPRVAGVFVNRLRKGMMLQTDPTVIYGMGDAYEGRIRKRDLQTDTPWNTYTRAGLPPTPIALAGKAALQAAVRPETHNYLYFVARGNGTSEFSSNLSEHNRNVARFILGQGRGSGKPAAAIPAPAPAAAANEVAATAAVGQEAGATAEKP